MTEDHREPGGPGEAAGNSRRGVLRLLGVGGASGLLAVTGLNALAGERPHQRLQDRTPKRNRKQRNKRQANNNNQNQNNTSNAGGGLGGVFSLGTSVAFHNLYPTEYNIRVIGENGDLNYVCPTYWNNTLSTADDDSPVTFVIQYSGWPDSLWIQAYNPLFGEPVVGYKANSCTGDCETTYSLSVGESFIVDWYGTPFKVERQSDSSDSKMILVTAGVDA